MSHSTLLRLSLSALSCLVCVFADYDAAGCALCVPLECVTAVLVAALVCPLLHHPSLVSLLSHAVPALYSTVCGVAL